MSDATGDKQAKISKLLDEAAETHHNVYRIVDGADDDWASWYADWLINLSELPEILGAAPVRSHLVHCLVQAERDFAAGGSNGTWQNFYAQSIIELKTA